MVGISHSYDHRLSVSKSNFNHLANRARVSDFLYKVAFSEDDGTHRIVSNPPFKDLASLDGWMGG